MKCPSNKGLGEGDGREMGVGSKDQVLKNQERMILNCVGARIGVRKVTQKTPSVGT